MRLRPVARGADGGHPSKTRRSKKPIPSTKTTIATNSGAGHRVGATQPPATIQHIVANEKKSDKPHWHNASATSSSTGSGSSNDSRQPRPLFPAAASAKAVAPKKLELGDTESGIFECEGMSVLLAAVPKVRNLLVFALLRVLLIFLNSRNQFVSISYTNSLNAQSHKLCAWSPHIHTCMHLHIHT